MDPLPPKKNNTRRNILLAVYVIAFWAILGTALLYGARKSEGLIDTGQQKLIDATMQQLNNRCPMDIDEQTRLIKAEGLPGKTMMYQYELVNIDAEDVDTTEVKSKVEATILNTIENDVQLAQFRVMRATFIYKYYDRQRNYIMTISAVHGHDGYYIQ